MTKSTEKMVRRLEREWRTTVRLEESTDDLKVSWRLAARADRLRRTIEAVRAGIVLPVPRTAKNLAKGAFVALGTIGKAIARALTTAARLARAQAVCRARRAAKAAIGSTRRTIATIALGAVASASLSTVSITSESATITIERQETMTTTKTESIIVGARKGPKSATARKVVAKEMRVVAFFRTFNRIPERMRVRTVEFVAPIGSTVEEMIAMAHKVGASTGARTPAGVFELQTDEGIWSCASGRKLLTTSNSGLHDEAAFKSWAAMEREERTEHRQAAKGVVALSVAS